MEISQTCAIFGETELVGHLLEGVEPARIAAGVNASVARRALAMVRRYRCPTLVCVGGVARNRAVVHFSGSQRHFRVMVPPYPQFNGALGCCLEAARRPGRGSGHEPPGRRMTPWPGPWPAAGARGRFPAPGREVGREPLPSSREVYRFTFPGNGCAVVGKFFSAYPPASPRRTWGWPRNTTTICGSPALGLDTTAAWMPRLLGRWPGSPPGSAAGGHARPGPGSACSRACVHGDPAPLFRGLENLAATAGLFSLPAGPGGPGVASSPPWLTWIR